MQILRQKKSRHSVALVAACMFVLQAVLGALTPGTAAASPLLDMFGNPLCITGMDMDAADRGSGGSGHRDFPGCCTAMCGVFAPLATDDRAAHSLPNPLSADGPPAFVLDAGLFRPAPACEPGSPRAPPPAA